MQATFVFLGTGGSAGIPMVGCHCEVCSSDDPHNKRFRPSGLLKIGEKRVLIDTGPDFRDQALCYQIDFLDGVLLTHSHFDHVAGLDELRSYYLIHRTPLPVMLSKATSEDLKKRYYYLFRKKSVSTSLPAQLELHELKGLRGTTDFLGLKISYTSYEQASMPVTGYRIGSLAYISDIRTYPETIFEDLQGVETLIVSALRHEPSMMHFNLEEAISFAQKAGAVHTYFTHMGHELDHASTNAHLPERIQLAYDGLELEFSYA